MNSILRIFFSVKPTRAFFVLFCLFIANIVEGIGLATLLPVISIASEQEGTDSVARDFVESLLGSIGLEPELGPLLIITTTALVLKSLISLLALGYVGYTAAEVVTDLRRKIVKNLLLVRWRFLVHQPSGRITNTISNDATRAADAYTLAATFMAMLGQTIVLSVVALVVSFKLAIFAFAIGLVMVAGLHVLVRMAKRAGFAQTKRTGELVVFLTDTLANLKLIRAMDRQEKFASLLERKITRLRKALRRQVVSREAVSNLQDAVMAVFLGGGFYVLYTNLTVPLPELLVSGLLVSRSVSSIGKLQKAYQKAVLLESSFESAHRLIAETEADPEPPSGNLKPEFTKTIQFSDVWFSYDETPVLQGLNLTVTRGELAVLMGKSGAGKSTVIDLLFGLYRQDAGQILVDGACLSDIDVRLWRQKIGFVPQDVTLLHDTIASNLTLGDDEIPENQIWEALRLAGVDKDVRELPDGLETIVGERGTRFSGGQRQRLSLARALVRDPEILVLDEVTSALDKATGELVAASVCKLVPQKTVLVVSHRPEFVDVADVVYYLENGKVTKKPNAHVS